MKTVKDEKTAPTENHKTTMFEMPSEFCEWLKGEAALKNEETSEILRRAVASYQRVTAVPSIPMIPDGYAPIQTAAGRAVLVPVGTTPAELRQVARVLEMMRMN